MSTLHLVICALRLALASSAAALAATVAFAQEVTIYTLQGQITRGSQNITTLGADLMGDKVNLYNGALEFNQTDVSLPGNNALPVAIGRRHVAGRDPIVQGEFGDWDLDVPHLHGVFATSKGWINATGTTARCSSYGPPPTYVASGTSFWYAEEYWQGNFISIPGVGSQEILRRSAANTLAPIDGQTYPLVTRDQWQFRCLPTIANAAGEGFVALSPDGTQYRFDWMTARTQPTLREGTGAGLYRSEFRLMATLVTDRHGNTVSYTYDPANPGRLTRIQSSDGRTIDVGYTVVAGKSRVLTVSDGTRTWTYSYTAQGDLDRVTLPDASSWRFNLRGLVYPYPNQLGEGASCNFTGGWPADTLTGTITHPSGAVGTFSTGYRQHARAAVSRLCVQKVAQGPTYDRWPKAFTSQTLLGKKIAGPGMADMLWSYTYSSGAGSWAPCTACTDTKTVTVTDPRGVVTRHTFGTRFQVSEGQLLRVDEAWNGSTALRTTTNRYRLPAGQPYPEPVGISPSEVGDYLAGRHRPLDQRVTSQQGVTFTWQADTFSPFARPVGVTRSSTLGYSRVESTVYNHFTHKWVINQVASITGAGLVMESHGYDPVTLYRNASYAFGRLLHSTVWNTDGTIYSRSDPAGHATIYSNYYRGLARNIAYPDGSGESATVANIGVITSHTNPAGHTTGYGYDAMGRLASITPPAGDPVTYHPTTLSFVPVASAEYGIAAGHWRQTIVTGNARTERYFDGLWRERLSRTYDNNNQPGTRRVVERRFDADNRTVFESYPQRDIDPVDALQPGTTNVFDALGRQVQKRQSSELGDLVANTAYLTGFQRQVTNPRGFVTTTAFQAFDSPSEDSITAITAPEGLNVAIVRDVFGKASSITRSGLYAGGPVSATRSYVYDGHQRLCKTIEPETGATVQAYDSAGNVAWRASGLALPSTANCDQAAVPGAAMASHGYDTMNRLTATSYGDASPGITRSYTADGLPLTVSSAGATWTYGYNALRLTTLESLLFGGTTYNIGRAYDAHGKLSSLSYPVTGLTLVYSPNALGEPTQVGPYASGIGYHPNGAVAGFTYGNGVVHSLTQNLRGLPEQWRDAAVMQDLYAYDANGNVGAITDQQEGVTTRTMGYDGLDRLTSTYAPGVWGNATYGYDPLDNLRSSVVGSRNSSHVYDPATNRLTALVNGVGTTNYGYDVQGNITSRGAQGFVFDRANRMSSATGKASYTYDGHGRRVRLAHADGSTRLQIYSQDGRLLHGAHSSQGVTQHVYLGSRLIAEVVGGVPQYTHADALGSPVARSNASGGVLNRTRYEPYGATAAGTNPTGIGFTGHANDADTGLVYMQQRYYEPAISRFVSLDPITTDSEDASAFNRYEYANSNPYTFRDPTGMLADPGWVANDDSATGTRISGRPCTQPCRIYGTPPSSSGGDSPSHERDRAIGPSPAANSPGGSLLDPSWEEVGTSVVIAASFWPPVRLGQMTALAIRSAPLVLGRSEGLAAMAAKEGGYLSRTTSNVPRDIYRQNSSDIRAARSIVFYERNVPNSLKDVEALNGRGQYARAEKALIRSRPELLDKTTFIGP